MPEPEVCDSAVSGGEIVDTSPSEFVTTTGVETWVAESSLPEVKVSVGTRVEVSVSGYEVVLSCSVPNVVSVTSDTTPEDASEEAPEDTSEDHREE